MMPPSKSPYWQPVGAKTPAAPTGNGVETDAEALYAALPYDLEHQPNVHAGGTFAVQDTNNVNTAYSVAAWGKTILWTAGGFLLLLLLFKIIKRNKKII